MGGGDTASRGFDLLGSSQPAFWWRERSVGNWYRTANYELSFAGNLYASRYYDAENTAYYVDPASTGLSAVIAGNVAIGLTSTTSRLQVRRISGVTSVPELRVDEGTQWYQINSNTAGGSYNTLVQAGDHSIIYSDGTTDTGALVIGPWSAGGKGLRIEAGGNVGIGVAASAKFDVNGADVMPLRVRTTNGGPWAMQLYRTDLGDGPRVYASDANTWYFNHTATAASSFRSPVFYDLDNTGFYCDPNSASGFYSLNCTNYLSGVRIGVFNYSDTSGYGISLYGGYAPGEPTYGMMFAGTTTFGTHGAVTADWATYFTMNNTASRGWIFRDTTNGNKASISNAGHATFSALTVSVDVRAPIFYDQDNTTYYVDPASTSQLNALNVAGNVGIGTSAPGAKLEVNGGIIKSNVTSTTSVGTGSHFTIENPSTGSGQSTFGWTFGGAAKASMRVDYTGNMIFSSVANNYYFNQDVGTSSTTFNFTTQAGAFQTMVGQFVTFPGRVAVTGNVTTGSTYARSASGKGYLDGRYGDAESTATSGAIYSIGSGSGGNYVPGTTTLGNMYGIGYTYGSTANTAGAGGGWGLYVASGGIANHFLDSDSGIISSTGSHKATQFIDVNDTSYYANPAGTSLLNAIILAGSLYFNNNISLLWKDGGGTNRRVGLVSAANTAYFGDIDNSMVGGSAAIFGKTLVSGYVDATQRSTLTASAFTIYPNTSGSATGLYVSGGDVTAARTANTGAYYFGTTGGGTKYLYYDGTSYILAGGALSTASAIYAPVYYDYSDSSYYLDPNSTTTSGVFASNVAIGTTTTGTRLNVVGAAGSPIAIFDGTTTSAYVRYQRGGATVGYVGSGDGVMSSGAAADFAISSYSGGKIAFGIYGTEKAKLSSTNFMISPGTSGATTGLYVNGGDVTASRTSTTGVYYFGDSGARYLQYDGSNYVLGGGALYSAYAIYAPSFYDYDNSGYYCDPASTSNFDIIQTGTSYVGGWNKFGDPDRDINSANYYPNTASSAWRFTFANAGNVGTGGNYAGVLQFHPWTGTTASTGDASYQFAFGSTAANGGGYPWLRIRKGIDTTWNSWYSLPLYDVNAGGSTGTLYAGAFSDGNDTAYYCNPNGTSRVSTLTAVALINAPDVINLGYTSLGSNSVATANFRGIEFHSPGDTNYCIGKKAGTWTQPLDVRFYTGVRLTSQQSFDYGVSVWNMTSGNIVASFAEGDDNTRIKYNLFSAGYVQSSSYIQGTLFYDANNTGYYCDPDSISNLYNVNTHKLGVQQSDGAGRGLSLYGGYASGQPTYGMMFAVTSTYGTYGQVSADWATYFTMDSTANRGWIFRDTSNGNKASISNGGYMSLAGGLGVGTSSSSTAGEIRATNNITAYYSDMRLKKYLGAIQNPLDKLMKLSGFYYTGNELAGSLGYNTEKPEVGVSAQEVLEVLPEIVKPAPIDDKYYTLDYARLVPLLIEAIKELKLEVDELKRNK